jgi:hypothetical protein
MVDLLKSAGAVPPLEVDAATLQAYVGKYKGDPGPEISITLKDGKLGAIMPGGRPFVLMALDKTTFRPTEFDGLTLTFNTVDGKTTGFALKQGPTTTQLKRVEEK